LLSAFTTGEQVASSPYPVLDKALSWWQITDAIERLAFKRDSP
jgi:hypothetical protein